MGEYIIPQRRYIASFLFSICFLFVGFTSSLPAEDIPPTVTVNIPMRDGKELPADIYLPEPTSEHCPCILVRTPAGKNLYKDVFIPLTKAGFAVVIQDTRSHIDPEGKTFPYVSDGWGPLQDGYDTVNWLAKSKYTNGQIGTMGFSAMGITQLLMAPSNPPALKCQYIGMAAGSLYHHAIYIGGQLLKNQVEGWLGYYARDPSVLNHVIDSPHYNEFWKGMDSVSVSHQVQVPALFYTGWFDTFLQGTLDSFVARQEQGGEGAKGRQKIVIGPWTHYWPLSMKIGDFEIPDIAKMPPVDISPLHWFNHYLRGVPNKIDELPAVTYFVMGPFDGTPSSGNVWKTAAQWPIPSTETSFYLSCPGKILNSAPQEACQATYAYDPQNPVPTLGGHNLFIEAGPKDQSSLESREDMLVFTSEPFEKDMEVTGRLKAKLFVSTDRDDTDVTLRLCDVYPDGRSILIADGICRLCTVEASSDPKKPKEVNIDLWSTSLVFAKGHRLRVLVSSSNHPRFEKNLNLGTKPVAAAKSLVAHNIIHTGGQTPSRLILPVIQPKAETALLDP